MQKFQGRLEKLDLWFNLNFTTLNATVFNYFVDCVVLYFVFFVNSSVNFAKQFCWLAIRLGSEEGIGRRGFGPY